MANKKEPEAQTEQAKVTTEEQKDALVCLDKTTNQYGVVTKMDHETGEFDWEAPSKDYQKRMLQIPTDTWVGNFFDKLSLRYGKPSEMGFSMFRVPIEVVGSLFDAIIKVRIEGGNDREATKLLERFELNDEGRIAKLANKYMFEERELPLKELAAWGVTPDVMREYKCMADFMKGRITDTPIPIKKEVNGEWKEMGEACFCATKVDGKTQLMVLPVLKKEQFNMAPFDKLFDEQEKERLVAQGHLGDTKVMKDFATGRECECYVSFHAPTGHLTTLPVDAIKIPRDIYQQVISVDDQKKMAAGGEIEVNDIKLRNGQIISGKARVDANRRDVFFTTGDDRTLKVGRTINGATISDQTAKILEGYGMAFVRNMRNPKTGQLYSDDVCFTRGSNTLLRGNAARRYKASLTANNTQRTQNRPSRRSVAPVPAPKQVSGNKPRIA